LKHLEATLIVCDKNLIVELDGTGNVLEIDDVIGVGSGGLFAECKKIVFNIEKVQPEPYLNIPSLQLRTLERVQ
jgi:ATP-dependent protease HslVU (ClpYQ) peptidase subunit